MSDSYAYFGPLTGYVPQVQAGLIVEYTKNPKRFAYQRYVDTKPVDYMKGFYRVLKNERQVRIVDVDRFSWPESGTNPALNKTDADENQFLAYTCQRYAAGDMIGDLTSQQTGKSGFDLLADTANQLASQMALLRTYRILNTLTTSGNWSGNTNTMTSIAGGKITAATSTNPYVRELFDATVVTIIQNTNGAIDRKALRAVMNPNTAKAIFNSQEMVDFTKQQPSVLGIMSGQDSGWNSEYWLPSHLFGVEVVIEDSVYITTEAQISPTRSFVMPDGDIIFMSVQGGNQPPQGSAFSTFTLFAFEDFKIETFYEQWNKRNLVWVSDNTAEVITAPASGYLVTACT